MGNVVGASGLQIDNNMLIIRTSKETLSGVIKHSKHALNSCPKGRPKDQGFGEGDIVLIATRLADLAPGEIPICHAMVVRSVYKDEGGRESNEIWGCSWKYIIDGYECLRLRNPFDINDVRATQEADGGYKAGGTYVYVLDEDKKVILDGGYLAVADDEAMSSDSYRERSRDKQLTDWCRNNP